MLEQLSTFIIHLIATSGYLGIGFLMTLESALIPIPSEVTMSFSGFLVSQGKLSFPLVVLAGTLGNIIGSLIAYAIGYYIEENLIVSFLKKYGKFLLLSTHEYDMSLRWFRDHGEIVTLVSRILPGVRTFISLPAGLAKMNLPRFVLYTFLGSVVWSTVLTWFGFYLGSKWHTLSVYFRKFDFVIVAILLIAIFYYINKKLKFIKI